MQNSATELNAKAKHLEGTELFQIVSNVKEKSLTLHFKHWDGRTLAASCTGVIHCNVSADGAEADTEVVGASVQRVSDDIFEHLRNFGYLWELNHEDGNALNGAWLHFSLDGDTSAAIICKEVAFS